MTDRTASRREIAPNAGVKEVMLISGTTLCAVTDTLTCTLADHGISAVLDVRGVVHTTENSVIVEEAGTTAVSGGVLTYTPASGNENKKRVVTVRGI
jgi:isopentenyl diphosphate isomerase/L-lactate dehydrogenase-like FMN-dependent dehydrogenase